MTDLLETWRTAPRLPRTEAACRAILVHIYPPGSLMGSRYLLHAAPSLIGRGPDCDIRISDPSVSRHHARIERDGDRVFLYDLKSTNGTYVNDRASASIRLKDGDYVRVGNCIYRFLAGDNIESAYHEEIYRRAIVDALTDIHNKRYLMEFLDREVARSVRYRRPLGLALFDVDHFKTINDRMGHLAGDMTLRELASRIKKHIGPQQVFGRYGGDEFALILPETTPEQGALFAERIRALVEKERFRYEGHEFGVTISMGLASTTGERALAAPELIVQADQKLYLAKSEGRNRVAS
jgi:diguanylate cyclase (GGDEF)-like protein